ncbi:hypothetical protein CEXT_633531 [Caerostris extrusa]|uniref:Uncharacterized protein n=1 Tax=Caerostris extrusa TaxID=172846 RepID=A0AAV4PFX2_CAEEX|nr:hypothetical protein CEXT_633531 [Caerostris extrusa]
MIICSEKPSIAHPTSYSKGLVAIIPCTLLRRYAGLVPSEVQISVTRASGGINGVSIGQCREKDGQNSLWNNVSHYESRCQKHNSLHACRVFAYS